MRRRSIGLDTSGGISPYEQASQGFLAGLINRVLFRNGTHTLLSRVLLGSGNSRLLTNSRTHKRPTPLSLDTLRSTPAIGTTPSLLSGFNSFLDHNHEDENDGDKKDEADAVEGLAQSASEFSAMLRNTPADVMAEVLGERRKEYSEYLWRLERARLAAQQRVHEIDARILQAVGERQAIEGQIQAMEIGTEEMETEDDSSCEMDNAPRLRKLTRSLVGHYSGITALDHDPDQGLVASGSLDTQARVWDASTGTCKYVVGGHSDAVRGVQFHSGFLLTASNDARIRMWDLSMLDSVQPQPGDSTTPPVTPTICRRVAPVDLCCETTFAGHQDAVTCFQAHDDTLVSGSADRTVRVWDLATGHERQTIDLAWGMRAVPVGDAYGLGTSLGDAGFVGALQFFGCALATGTADGILRLWDLRTAQAHRQLAGHAQPITALGFDDRHVVSGSLDRSVRLWDLRMGRVLQTLDFAGPVTAVQLLSKSRSFAAECWAAASDARLHHYRTDSMQRMAYDASPSLDTVSRICSATLLAL